MSSAIFPTISGLTWDLVRTPIWDTTTQTNVSGKEVRMSNYSYPRYQWDLTVSAFRQGLLNAIRYSEFTDMLGFYNARQGAFDSFLYQDDDDKAVTGQVIGVGDGVTSVFQLVRTLGGFVEPMLAPKFVTAVYLDGVPLDAGGGGNWDYRLWSGKFGIEGGDSVGAPGQLGFGAGHIPGNGVVITADFSYYWPCRFLNDTIAFNKFNAFMYGGQKISLISLKS